MVMLLVVAMPAALGDALGPVLRELVGPSQHVCKCGMPVGQCGCQACARVERERLREQQPDPLPALKRHCGDEAPTLPRGPALHASVLPASGSATLSVPRGDRIPVGTTTPFKTSTKNEPPTPPPRSASV
jgi:hypothetical protein